MARFQDFLGHVGLQTVVDNDDRRCRIHYVAWKDGSPWRYHTFCSEPLVAPRRADSDEPNCLGCLAFE